MSIATINRWADAWFDTMTAVLWQSVLLIALAGLIAWLLCRTSPVVRYWLWQIVAVKLLLMPFWTFAIPVPTWLEKARIEQTAVESPQTYSIESTSLNMQVRGNTSPMPLDIQTKTVPYVPSLLDKFNMLSWRAWLLIVWLFAVFAQIIRLWIQHHRLENLLKRAKPAGGAFAVLVAELAGRVGLRRVPVAVSVSGNCPLFVCGLWNPRLVLPLELLESLEPDERRQVLLHELAHVKRRDLLWGWPVEIARILYFFNPLVYWNAYQIRFERELSCDQLAMSHSGNSADEYARTLVQVISQASEPAAVQAAAIAVGLTGGETADKDTADGRGR